MRRWSDLVEPSLLRPGGRSGRFVWWPSLLEVDPGAILARVAACAPDGAAKPALPSQHREVSSATWRGCARCLPEARRLAGTFPASSGPNCFGAAMTATGIADCEEVMVLEDQFLCWLEYRCRPGGRDGAAGTVLVWRDAEAVPVHAAVTLGDGWALEKASSEWWTPYAVRPVDQVILNARRPGQHLERHRLV